MDQPGWRQHRKRGWFETIIHVAFVGYHLPILIAYTSLSKRRTTPAWVLFGASPVLYSCVLYLMS